MVNLSDMKMTVGAVAVGTLTLVGMVWAAGERFVKLETQVLEKQVAQQRIIDEQQQTIRQLIDFQRENVGVHSQLSERVLRIEVIREVESATVAEEE